MLLFLRMHAEKWPEIENAKPIAEITLYYWKKS